MKVLGISKFGRRNLAFVEQHPKPIPQTSTDVLIKIEYSDLNPVDHHKLNMKADGVETPDHRTPYIVGFGGSGIVEEVSTTADDETRSLLNKRVIFIADPSKDGSYAEYICCDRRIVSPIPESIKSHEAACIPIAGCTALESLSKVGLPISDSSPTTNCKGEGKRLLIIGGSGGVGSFATLLARSNYPSLDIVCTVGSDESSNWCKKMGCNRTIKHEDIQQLGSGPKGSCDQIICLTEPQEVFESIAEVLRPQGKICLVVAGDGIKNLDLSFVFFKSGTVCCETVFGSIRDNYFLDQAGEMSTILKLVEQGRVLVPLNEKFDDTQSDWNESIKEGGYIDLVGGGRMKGKLVMKISH